MLGAARDPQGFPSLLRMLALPEDKLDFLLGDAVTQTLSRIVVGMFDGDGDALLAAIADTARDDYVRDALLGAAAFLTWEGRIDRARMSGFLAGFFDTPLAEPDDFVWSGWLKAVGLLGLEELAPQAARVFGEQYVDPVFFEARDLDELLAETARAPDDPIRFAKNDLGYIEDVIVALEWTDHDEETDADDVAWHGLETSLFDPAPYETHDPVLNPWRHIGRNDPCPCGSSRKFKKCCLPKGGPAAIPP